jgi:hypothetical protein
LKLLIDLVILLLVAYSCGKRQDLKRQFTSIHEDLQPYVDFYENEKGSSLNQSIGMGFKSLPYLNKEKTRKYVGICYEFWNGEKEIHIDTEFWYNSTESQKRLLMLHELGHCDLDRDHEERLGVNGKPISIMFPSLFDWGENEEGYIRELFL